VAALVAGRGKRWFAVSLTLTALQWTARYSVATAVIVTLGGPLRPYLYWVLGWMTYAVSSVVPTPGSAGAAEATFYLLHRPVVPLAVLGVATALWRLLLFYLPVALSVVVWPALGVVERRADAAAAAADTAPVREPVAENPAPSEGASRVPLPSSLAHSTPPHG
jgi:uncharacterized membrane protein YbhN (UPF0104 family)